MANNIKLSKMYKNKNKIKTLTRVKTVETRKI